MNNRERPRDQPVNARRELTPKSRKRMGIACLALAAAFVLSLLSLIPMLNFLFYPTAGLALLAGYFGGWGIEYRTDDA